MKTEDCLEQEIIEIKARIELAKKQRELRKLQQELNEINNSYISYPQTSLRGPLSEKLYCYSFNGMDMLC